MAKKNNRIRVLIVEDHPLFREGLRNTLLTRPGIELVGEAANGEEAVRMTKELKPDVVLVDISMPRMDGLTVMKRLTRAAPKVKTIALTAHDSKEYIHETVRSGARGYLLKDISGDELTRAIEAVYCGEVYCSKPVAKFLVDFRMEKEGVRAGKRRDGLSRREREVLALIAEGYTNKEIADQLCVSMRTAETHRGHIMQKLGIHSAAALTRFAISQGIVTAGLARASGEE
ncbi:MAG: response regulator transcription factor [Ignavibacteria bacterium]|nr:MAG: response regulator transcription factor [Ignavibacteria bacterium]